MDRTIKLERKCSVNHRWFLVAHFELGIDARDCAEALSKQDGTVYRVVNHRWPDPDQPMVVLYAGGEMMQ